MKEFVVDSFNDVNWRQYREFGKALRKVTEGVDVEEDVTFDELKVYMLVAAINGGWIPGVEAPSPPVVMDDLDEWSAIGILSAADKVFNFYNGLRTPDPN
jgi:hypothetical protein